MFFKVELTIILNGFLNILLSFTRCECNADRCPSRKCDKFAFCVNGLVSVFFFFVIINNFFFFFPHTTQHNIQNKTKQQTHTQHLKVQSKGRERGKDNKNTKVTPLNNYVYSTKNTAKPQWLKAWPHRLAPLYIHMRQFAGGYGSNMPLYTCVV